MRMIGIHVGIVETGPCASRPLLSPAKKDIGADRAGPPTDGGSAVERGGVRLVQSVAVGEPLGATCRLRYRQVLRRRSFQAF